MAECPLLAQSGHRARGQSMPIAKTYLPKQWTDWTTWLLGIWLCLSPWTLLFEFEAPAVKNAVLLGALIILAELVELSIFRGWQEWINVALGAWLIASTWVLGIVTPAARTNYVANTPKSGEADLAPMSAFGTKRTSRVALHMSAFRGKADIASASQNVRL